MNCTMLADLSPCFHRSATKLCPDLVSFACRIVPEFWASARKSGRSRSKLGRISCRSRSTLCPNFGRSCARLSPIYFAPCPFPNPTGTLLTKALRALNAQPTDRNSKTGACRGGRRRTLCHSSCARRAGELSRPGGAWAMRVGEVSSGGSDHPHSSSIERPSPRR